MKRCHLSIHYLHTQTLETLEEQSGIERLKLPLISLSAALVVNGYVTLRSMPIHGNVSPVFCISSTGTYRRIDRWNAITPLDLAQAPWENSRPTTAISLLANKPSRPLSRDFLHLGSLHITSHQSAPRCSTLPPSPERLDFFRCNSRPKHARRSESRREVAAIPAAFGKYLGLSKTRWEW